MAAAISRIIGADWVIPISRTAIRDGAVAIVGDQVAWVGPADDLPTEFASIAIEYQPGIMVPGFVNAHTHLQYTGFNELGRGSYSGFEHWSQEFETLYCAVKDPEDWGTAAREGARLAIKSGTTSVAEIVTDDPARGAMSEAGLGGIEYLEVIGRTEIGWTDQVRQDFVRRLMEDFGSPRGVSPHAPYSLDGRVIQDLVAIARANGMRVHSHVGESELEGALYESGVSAVLEIYGDLRDEFALVSVGGVGMTTARYAGSIGLLGADVHLAHGIYLQREDRDLVKSTGTQVVLCPRSNQVIGLDAPPIAAYLHEDHDIAIGTDSLASVPSLDLLGDMTMLAALARAQGYGSDDLHQRMLHAATRGGARAIGRSDIGLLEVGARADIAVFAVDAFDAQPEQALVDGGAGRCVLTIIGGRTVHAVERQAQRKNSL